MSTLVLAIGVHHVGSAPNISTFCKIFIVVRLLQRCNLATLCARSCCRNTHCSQNYYFKGGVDMTKAEFVAKLSEKVKITKKQATDDL